jgi:hypothetical protein
MADTYVTEPPPGSERRRSSVAKIRYSVSEVFSGGNVNINRKDSISVTSKELDEIYAQKQAAGEAFSGGGDTRWYKPIDTYEGRHRWDPNAEWTKEEEKKIVRKVET